MIELRAQSACARPSVCARGLSCASASARGCARGSTRRPGGREGAALVSLIKMKPRANLAEGRNGMGERRKASEQRRAISLCPALTCERALSRPAAGLRARLGRPRPRPRQGGGSETEEEGGHWLGRRRPPDCVGPQLARRQPRSECSSWPPLEACWRVRGQQAKAWALSAHLCKLPAQRRRHPRLAVEANRLAHSVR